MRESDLPNQTCLRSIVGGRYDDVAHRESREHDCTPVCFILWNGLNAKRYPLLGGATKSVVNLVFSISSPFRIKMQHGPESGCVSTTNSPSRQIAVCTRGQSPTPSGIGLGPKYSSAIRSRRASRPNPRSGFWNVSYGRNRKTPKVSCLPCGMCKLVRQRQCEY